MFSGLFNHRVPPGDNVFVFRIWNNPPVFVCQPSVNEEDNSAIALLESFSTK
jgi:hypothetical protein